MGRKKEWRLERGTNKHLLIEGSNGPSADFRISDSCFTLSSSVLGLQERRSSCTMERWHGTERPGHSKLQEDPDSSFLGRFYVGAECERRNQVMFLWSDYIYVPNVVLRRQPH